MIDKAMEQALCSAAIKARENSYSPYSSFKVGAALLCENGEIVTGCNVENAAYTPTNCAERTAVFTAVSKGHRRFKAIAVCGGKTELTLATPCGVCRQVLREFCQDDMPVLCVTSADSYEKTTLGDLLPKSFGPDSLI